MNTSFLCTLGSLTVTLGAGLGIAACGEDPAHDLEDTSAEEVTSGELTATFTLQWRSC
jgi:hypothetical protein